MLIISGCVPTVRPDADRIALEVRQGVAPVELQDRLLDHGFDWIDLAVMGGPRPEGGKCLEKARGGSLYGVDVVRVCFGPGGMVDGVHAMQTHGGLWTQVYEGEDEA